jgi:hypothetical protein
VDETGPVEHESTGVPAVDAATALLAELDGLPTGEHVAHYEAAHRRLQDALADLDTA